MDKNIKELDLIRRDVAILSGLLEHLKGLRGLTDIQIAEIEEIQKDFAKNLKGALLEKRREYNDVTIKEMEIDRFYTTSGFSYRPLTVIGDMELKAHLLYKQIRVVADGSSDKLLKAISDFQCFGIGGLKAVFT